MIILHVYVELSVVGGCVLFYPLFDLRQNQSEIVKVVGIIVVVVFKVREGCHGCPPRG